MTVFNFLDVLKLQIADSESSLIGVLCLHLQVTYCQILPVFKKSHHLPVGISAGWKETQVTGVCLFLSYSQHGTVKNIALSFLGVNTVVCECSYVTISILYPNTQQSSPSGYQGQGFKPSYRLLIHFAILFAQLSGKVIISFSLAGQHFAKTWRSCLM